MAQATASGMTDLNKESQTLLAKKLEISAQIRKLRVEMGVINQQLVRAGAPSAAIACW